MNNIIPLNLPARKGWYSYGVQLASQINSLNGAILRAAIAGLIGTLSAIAFQHVCEVVEIERKYRERKVKE